LRPVEAEVVIKALGRIGFHPVRHIGSYLIMKQPDGRSTVIPVHPGEELGRGILMEINRSLWSCWRARRASRQDLIAFPAAARGARPCVGARLRSWAGAAEHESVRRRGKEDALFTWI
jgi:predicted RNA binding protein YcfA (HicA-like mRNA interferase family)